MASVKMSTLLTAICQDYDYYIIGFYYNSYRQLLGNFLALQLSIYMKANIINN